MSLTIGTNTHQVTRPGYEGPCCADCAAAIGLYRALPESSVDFGEPCWSCQEMVRDAYADAIRAKEERAFLDLMSA